VRTDRRLGATRKTNYCELRRLVNACKGVVVNICGPEKQKQLV